uniref:Uncharacterized protein n=1 Tax=Felis catus TaxID=9685 RepID=A0ABI7YF33_FELCA
MAAPSQLLQIALQHVREEVAGAELHRVPAQRLADLRHRDPQQRPGVTLAHPAPWTPPQPLLPLSPPPPPNLSRALDSSSRAPAAGKSSPRPLATTSKRQQHGARQPESRHFGLAPPPAGRSPGRGSTSRMLSAPMRKLRPVGAERWCRERLSGLGGCRKRLGLSAGGGGARGGRRSRGILILSIWCWQGFASRRLHSLRLKTASVPDVGQGIIAALQGDCPRPPDYLSVNSFDGTD